MGLYLETLQLYNFIQLKLLSLSSSLLFSTISFYAFEKQFKTVKNQHFLYQITILLSLEFVQI